MTTLGDALRRSTDPADLLDRVVQQALTLVPGADGASLEIRRTTDELEYVSTAGTLTEFRGLVLSVHGSLSGLCLLTGQVKRSDDAWVDDRVDRPACTRTGIRSMLCVPLSSDPDSVAVLKVSSQQEAAFGPDDERVMLRLTGFLHSALEAAGQLARVTTDLFEDELDSDPDMIRTAEFVANVIDPDLAVSVAERESIERALSSGGPDIVVQPVRSLETGEIVTVEALSRFPTMPTVTPDLVFATAHRAGLGPDLEIAAVRAALKVGHHLPATVALAVNASPAALQAPEMIDLLVAHGDPGVVVEVTESSCDHDELDRILVPLRSADLQIAVDDTGAGYSSLARTLILRPDIIKIDRALTSGIETDLGRQVLAEALVRFAAGLGARLVAEGIETATAAALLQEMGVRLGQGFHLGRPAPVDEIDWRIPAVG